MASVTIARYAWGVVALLIVAGSLTAASVGLRGRWLGEWTGAIARLAEVTIGLALLIAILEVLGTIGLFRLGPIVAACALAGLGTARALGTRPGARVRAAREGGATRLPAAAFLAIAAAALVIAEWASPTLDAYAHGIRTFDSLWYHLPWAASFAHSAQITSLRFTDVEYLTAFYPATAELLHGAGIALTGRDTLSPGLNLVWLALVLLAAYCIGRPRRLGAATLLGATLAMATPMMRFSQAGSAANDVVGIFFLLASVAFLMHSQGRTVPLALAALAAGLAVSVKLSMLAAALGLTVGAIAIAPAGGRRVATAAWLVPFSIAGGFWYLRNLIAVGNPLPWLSLPLLATPSPPLQQHTAFSVAHYATDTHIWTSVFAPGLLAGLGNWWPVLVIAALIGPLLCLLPGADARLRMLAVVALGTLLAYLVTPESAAGPAGHPAGFAFNLRYAAPGLSLCLTLLPLAPALRRERFRLATLCALAVLLVATVAQARLWPHQHLGGAIAVALVCAAMAALIAYRPARARVFGPLQPVALGVGILVLVLAGAGYGWQRQYLRGRYAFQPGISSLSKVWALFRGVHDARVGIVGTFGGFFAYPLDGIDDSNSVLYVGRHGPHGSFTPLGTCPEWRRAVNAGHFGYVVTTPARDPWHPRILQRSPEGGWTSSDPAARLIFSSVAAGQRILVFRLFGPLDPRTCA